MGDDLGVVAAIVLLAVLATGSFGTKDTSKEDIANGRWRRQRRVRFELRWSSAVAGALLGFARVVSVAVRPANWASNR